MVEFSASDDSAELKRLRFALQSAQIGTWTLDIIQQQVWWDDKCKELYGFRQDDIVPYDQVLSYMHDEDRQRVNEAVKRALDPQSGGHYDTQFRTVGAEDGQVRWLHCRGQAEFNADGIAYRFAGIAQEITLHVRSEQALLASEARFRSLIEEAPVATSLFIGRQLRVEVANSPMLAIWGKGPEQIGKTFAEVLPEIASQSFLTILDDVYTSGRAYSAKGGRADLVINGVPGTYYFDFVYKPLFDANHQVYGIMQMATDVTAQVLAHQHLEEKEVSLSSAIELAELGTFSVDLATNALTVSPRVADWFGFESLSADAEAFINGVSENERDYVRTSLYATLQPESAGRYNVVHSVINAKTGQRRILSALGQLYVNTAGEPLKIEGTAQDITIQQELKQVLEQEVQQRTEELASSNEELAATNEELATSNEELEEANSLLVRSNDNLQTFAYIASHDLQEPLRKIQQFGDLLKTRFADSIGGEELIYLDRMQVAARHMSMLVRDLLSFSRISTQRNTEEPVALRGVVDSVLGVLDFAIIQAEAQVHVDPLPIIVGDAVQLGQLFQNLLSNALKFCQPERKPRITIRSQQLSVDQLPPTIKPGRRSEAYHRIEVADNGIGFEEKYLDRIFQVFQRLHGKGLYQGTGVGLAICEKVVTNHGGVITASSQLGQGTAFYVYLPAE